MKVLLVTENEAGQRLDKLLLKYLNEASSSFLFKMIRKKNITLNGKKAVGNEKLVVGDEIKLFLSDETIEKFSSQKNHSASKHTNVKLDIIYEDTDILLINKPSGMLSQKSAAGDVSLNEYCLDYLLDTGAITTESLKTFKPSVCNRLDRNTSGIVIFGKSLRGTQAMSEALKNRTLHKYYQCIVIGKVDKAQLIKGYLIKNEATNQVQISDIELPDADYIETRYQPLQWGEDYTLLEVELITGKPHQIRAHLASIDRAIIGDYKYGNRSINNRYREQYGVTSQLLHSYRLVMPVLGGEMSHLSEREFKTELPSEFRQIIEMPQ